MWQMKALEKTKGWRALLTAEKVIMISTSVLAAGIVTVGVFMRYILKMNFMGQEELLTVVAMWLYWVGGIYCSQTNSHISADIFDSFVKSWKVRKAVSIIVLAICLTVGAFFTWWGFTYTAWIWNLGGHSTGLKIPLIISKCTMLLGFGLMALFTLYNLIVTAQKTAADYDQPAEPAAEIRTEEVGC